MAQAQSKSNAALEQSLTPTNAAMPNCVEVEATLLGLLMYNNDLYNAVSRVIESDFFYEEVHVQIYCAIGLMVTAGKPASPITLKPYVGDDDLGEGVTPFAYLTKLVVEFQGTPSQAMGYAAMIRDFAARRTVIRSCQQTMKDAWEPGFDITVGDLLRLHEDRVELVRPKVTGARTGYRAIGKIAQETAQRVQDEWKGDKRRSVLTTGFKKLDARTGGLEAPNLIILGGRPASGKTALAIDMAINASIQLVEERLANPDVNPGVIGIVSAEMSGEQLSERTFARIAQVSGTRIKRRSLESREVEKLWLAAGEIGRLPIEVDDTGGQSISMILARARALHRKMRLRMLVVDYLQLIKGFRSRGNDANRHMEISEITSSLKELCKELNIPILLLSQVGRQVDQRENKRPNPSDLKESGSIEQDADMILFVYREESYVINDKPAEGTEGYYDWERKFQRVQGIAEIIVAKNRFGGPGTVVMGYDGPHTTFLEEPVARAVDPEEVRERIKKEPKLRAPAALLYEIAKGMLLHHGRPATEAEREREALRGKQLPRNVRLIDRATVFKTWFDDRMPDKTVAQGQSAFMAAMDELRERRMTASIGSKEDGVFLWLPETVAK